MPRKNVVVRSVRIPGQTYDQLRDAARSGGFNSASALIRVAIDRELAGTRERSDETERIVASLDRVTREFRSLRLRHQAEFAFLDALAKTLLTHLPEVPKEAYEQAVARAKMRYDRFLKSVGMGMSGDSETAMKELLRRGED